MGTFFHGEYLGFDVAVDLGFVLQFAALGSDLAFDVSVNFHVARSDIAFHHGILTDGDLALVGSDFPFDLSIDNHVVREADGADDFDAGGEDVCRVCHSASRKADAGQGGNRKQSQNSTKFLYAPESVFALETRKPERLTTMPRVLITVPEKNAQPYRFQLDRKVVSLGRGSDNDIVIESGSVSGKHAEMHRVEGGYQLKDLGSTNGIKVDGSRQKLVALRSGMSVKLGDVAFDFTLSEEELDAIAREKPMAEPVEDRASELPPAPPREEKPRRREQPRQVAVQPSSNGGIGMILLFLVLAAASFFAGLAIRHQKETGESLINAISNKGKAEKMEPIEEK